MNCILYMTAGDILFEVGVRLTAGLTNQRIITCESRGRRIITVEINTRKFQV